MRCVCAREQVDGFQSATLQPHPFNNRVPCENVMNRAAGSQPVFAAEQEYVMYPAGKQAESCSSEDTSGSRPIPVAGAPAAAARSPLSSSPTDSCLSEAWVGTEAFYPGPGYHLPLPAHARKALEGKPAYSGVCCCSVMACGWEILWVSRVFLLFPYLHA